MDDWSARSKTSRLNSEYRHALSRAQQSGVLPADPLQTSLQDARRDAERWHTFWHGNLPVVRKTVDHAAAGPAGPVTLRFFYPVGRLPRATAIWFHGGGFVLNGLRSHERLMRDLAVRGGVVVCGVDYSLAPEQRFPVQVEEALESVRWVVRHADDLGLRSDRLALCGDSAGAGLALATACTLRDAGTPIDSLLLFYGMYAADFDTPSHATFGDGSLGLSTARMQWFWRQYLPRACDRLDPRAAPLFADLTNLPPTLVIAAGLDCLRDDSLRLAMRLEAAGVPHELSVYADLPHGFATMASAVSRADEALTEAAEVLARMAQPHRHRFQAARPAA